MKRTVTLAVLTWAVLSLWVADGTAQELTPRAYWPAPKGTRVVVFGYTYATGDVVTDPSLPIVGVDSRINTGLFAYLQTLSLWGRTANIVIELPYSWGTTEGDLEGESTRRDFSGIADIAVTLSVNLIGAPSMTPADFQELRRRPRPILGASIKLVAPAGDYDPEKLINIGTNRWAIKGELGYIIPLNPKWLLELDLGTWVIGDNDDFLGVTREQNPVVASQIHLVRRFKPGFWASMDLNYYVGGRSTIGGDRVADLQRNSRFGGTLVVPFRGRHGFKVGYSTGVVTESGGDFNMLLLSYSRLFR